MNRIFIKELKMNSKMLLIWSLAVGGIGFACLLLYSSMEGEIRGMADAFSNMGMFSDAFGMSTLSIATIKGYFATEVGTVHGLGGSMFAALIAVGMLSKEEEHHTGEFLYSLPVSRRSIVLAKAICILAMIVLFSLICTGLYALGFVILGEELPVKEFTSYMAFQLVMNIEIAGICFALSSVFSKTMTGASLGLALIFYLYDLLGRVIPDLKKYLFIGPFSYANASDIFSGADLSVKALCFGGCITVICLVFAFIHYDRRDLAA
ncbi:MAG: ABC transporter permease [Lachnospiraceae bacterium]|nr:ABC transporter permease [Lachnospiraceae bacterium]